MPPTDAHETLGSGSPEAPRITGKDLADLTDLSGRDLRFADLRDEDLRGRDFSSAHLDGANLDGADLRDVGLEGTTLVGASLRGAVLVGAGLRRTVLQDADLTGADLDGADLEGCVLDGAILAKVRACDSHWRAVGAQGGDWTGADLTGSTLERCTFSGVDMTDARLEGLEAKDCTLTDVVLRGASLRRSSWLDSTWTGVDAGRAGLVDAVVRFADFERVRLKAAELDGALLESVAFQSPDLVGVRAAGARFVRCAGLDAEGVDRLRRAGATVPMPILRRLWQAAGRLPGGRITALVLLLAAGGGGAWALQDRSGTDGAESGPAVDIEALDEASRRSFHALEAKLRESPDRRQGTLLALARLLEDAGQPGPAETSLRQAVESAQAGELEPDVEPLLALGDFLVRTEQYDDAVAFARELDQAGASPLEVAVGNLLLSRTLLARGDALRAADALGPVSQHFVEHPKGPVALRLSTSAAYEELGDFAGALAILQELPEAVSMVDRAEAALARAAVLGRLGNLGAALGAYDAVVRSFPDLQLVVARARDERSRLLAAEPDPETMRRQLRSLAESTDSALALQGELGLARLAVRLEQRTDALARLKGLQQRFGDQPDLLVPATVELAGLYWSGGETEAALALLTDAVERVQRPENRVDLREELADRLVDVDRFEEAEQTLAKTLAEFADDLGYQLRAKLQLGGVADRAGDFDRAIDLYREVAAAEFDAGMTAAAFFGQATLLRRRGDPKGALPLMDGALSQLPAQHRMRGSIALERAELLLELGGSSTTELQAMLGEARAAGLETEQPAAYTRLLLELARRLASDGRHDDALQTFQRVADSVASGEDTALRQDAIEGQVAALVALDRKDQADALLDRTAVSRLSTGAADENCSAGLSLARGRVGTGDLSGAADRFATVFEACRAPRFLVEQLPDVTDLLREHGLVERAVAILRGVRDGDAPAVGRQAAALELGRLGSESDLELAAEGPDSSLGALARVELASLMFAQDRSAEAILLWLKVAEDETVEPDPRARARLGLGRARAQAGNREEAKALLTEVRDRGPEEWLRDEAARALVELRLEAPAPEGEDPKDSGR